MQELCFPLLLGEQLLQLAILIEEDILLARPEAFISRGVTERVSGCGAEFSCDLCELDAFRQADAVLPKKLARDLINNLVHIAGVVEANLFKDSVCGLDDLLSSRIFLIYGGTSLLC